MDKLKVYAKTVEESAMSQIEEMSKCEAYKDCIIRIMPDCHAGKGCTIGTVIEVKDRIVPNTVGEFTGMRDKHGKKVFEGDVVRRRESALGYVKTGVVKYDCHLGAFVLEYESYGETCKSTFDNEFSENDGNCTIRGTYSYEIIGNVYDNPDLLLSK